MKRKLIAAIALMLAAPAAGQAPTTGSTPSQWTAFGLELGKPIAIPTCKHKILPGGYVSQFTYEDDSADTCYEPDIQLSDAPWRRGSVDFPLAKVPLIVHGSSGFTLIVNGKLEGLKFDTLGHANTDAIIAQLSQKFGRPTSVSRVIASPSGIPVPAIHAEWKLRGLYVSYRNIDISVDYGELLIETPAMQGLRNAHDQASERERTKL